MEESIRQWIATLGFPIFACFAVGWFFLKVFGLWQKALDENKAAAAEIARLAREQALLVAHDKAALMDALNENSATMERNSHAAGINTNAIQSLADYMKKFGSDPMGLCKWRDNSEQLAKLIEEKTGVRCSADEVMKVLQRQGKVGTDKV